MDPTSFMMVLTGISHPAFMFYRLGGKFEWTKQDYTLSCQQKCMQFTHAIGFKGKFYALSLQGALAVIEEVDSRLTVTALLEYI